MVVSQKMIVKAIAIVLLFFKKNTDSMCPMIAHMNDITSIEIELLGVLSNISTPISNIFWTIAVEIARSAHIGNRSRTYLPTIPHIFCNECLNVWRHGLGSKCLSYSIIMVRMLDIINNAMMN